MELHCFINIFSMHKVNNIQQKNNIKNGGKVPLGVCD
jgi:hypothetical protein